MKKFIVTILVGVIISTLMCVHANAITIGKWDFSGVQERIQDVAKDLENTSPDGGQNPPGGNEVEIPKGFLEQLYKARKAQLEYAINFWNSK